MSIPCISAATEIAAVINSAWSDAGLPPVLVKLAPSVDPMTGEEAVNAAYAIPLGQKIDRMTRSALNNEVAVAVVLVMEADETSASTYLDRMYDAARGILAAGGANDVRFINAELVDPVDAALLANSHIFRSQLNVNCMVMSSLCN